jgi:GNAT superfamily N-acetyltransferase
MTVIIRDAVATDLPVLQAMLREFADYLNTIADPEPVDESAFARLGNLLFGPHAAGRVLLAEDGEGCLGYLAYVIGIDLEAAYPTLQIADLFVRDGARRHGIGRALMAEAGQRIRDLGGTTLLWHVWRKNPAALDFYRQLGAAPVEDELLMKWVPAAAG